MVDAETNLAVLRTKGRVDAVVSKAFAFDLVRKKLATWTRDKKDGLEVFVTRRSRKKELRAPAGCTDFEKQVYAKYAPRGCVMRSGWPDFLVVGFDGSLTFVEAKGEGDQLRPHQRDLINALVLAGLRVEVAYQAGSEILIDKVKG